MCIRDSFSCILSYSAMSIPEIADDFYQIDDAIRTGYAWSYGPFEIWDNLGIESGVEMIKSCGEEVPNWINEMSDSGIKIANQIGTKRKMSISEGAGYIAHIQGMLDNIDAERDSLVALHQHVLKRVSKTVDGEFESYKERSIVHTILEDPSRPLDLDRVARDLLIHSKDMQMVIDGIRGHLANTNTEEIFMPADSTTPLPWWIQG